MARRRFSLGLLFVGMTAAAVAFLFLFIVVPQFLHLAAESGTTPLLPIGAVVFIIYLMGAGWWQIRGGATPVAKPPSGTDDQLGQ